MKFSVLLSVYKKEKPEFLQVALQSIVNQTLMPDEILIVKDGLLTDELDYVINMFQCRYPNLIHVLVFKKNRGLGLALRDGVLACKYNLIARMDTDDISHPNRFEKQIDYLNNNPDIAMVGSWITEFSSNPDKPDTITKLPYVYKDVVKYAKYRNPFRHMTLIYKKDAIIDSGNYQDFLGFEDYDLWIRMIQKGYIVVNIPEVLVNVRADDDMFARRGGWQYLKNELCFQKHLLTTEFINYFQFLGNIFIRFTIRLIPNKLRLLVYRKFLRESN